VNTPEEMLMNRLKRADSEDLRERERERERDIERKRERERKDSVFFE
jgi:hypothetical protein